MKKKFAAGLAAVMLTLGTAGISSASTLTFDEGTTTLGVGLGGSMSWNNIGGGHLFMQQWSDTDYILTIAPNTYVNDFQMNYQPWQGYGSTPANGSGWPVDIKAYDAANNLIWSQKVDLSSTASDWNNWLTITVNTADVAALAFGPTGGGPDAGYFPSGYWPSIDNLRINEAGGAPVPEPSTFMLLGAGLVGLGFLKRRKRS